MPSVARRSRGSRQTSGTDVKQVQIRENDRDGRLAIAENGQLDQRYNIDEPPVSRTEVEEFISSTRLGRNRFATRSSRPLMVNVDGIGAGTHTFFRSRSTSPRSEAAPTRAPRISVPACPGGGGPPNAPPPVHLIDMRTLKRGTGHERVIREGLPSVGQHVHHPS
jgi:hypothetical protein